MAEINDLNVVDASNTARWPEGMAPSAVNNAGRADEGILARWHKDGNGSIASTGSANAYLFAAGQTISAYYDGLTVTFDANFTNTGAATLNVDSVSADSIVRPDGAALRANDIISGSKVTVRHDGTNWQIVGGTSGRPPWEDAAGTSSGTSVDTSSIGTYATRITLILDSVSTSGTDTVFVQVGTGGTPATSGYTSGVGDSTGNTASTAGFPLTKTTSLAADGHTGELVLSLANPGTNAWVAHWEVWQAGSDNTHHGAGRVALAGALDIVRLTSSGGSVTFDSGNIRVLVE